MLNLYDCSPKERQYLLENQARSVIVAYIARAVIQPERVWSLHTRQPIHTPREYMEIGMDKKELAAVRNAIKEVTNDPTDEALELLRQALSYFEHPYDFSWCH